MHFDFNKRQTSLIVTLAVLAVLLAMTLVFFPDRWSGNRTAPDRIAAGSKTKILAWGANDAGQLGNGLKASSTITPLWAVQVEKILEPNFSITAIDGGVYTTCLLRSDKTVWCWGGGDSHDATIPPLPVAKIDGLPPIKLLQMGSGYLNCATAEDGSIWCWNRAETQAHPVRYPQWTPRMDLQVDYQALQSSFVYFYPGMSDACAITGQRKLWCWGKTYSNDGVAYVSGQDNHDIFPVAVPLEKDVVSVNVGFSETCAILVDQSAWCWSSSRNPAPYKLFQPGEEVKQVFAGWDKGCALKDDGTVWCWRAIERSGYSPTAAPSPEQVRISSGKILDNVRKLDNQGNTLFCALRKDTSVWCWGGLGGDPGRRDKNALVRIKAPNGICNIGNAVDITTGSWSGYAVVHDTQENFAKLEQVDLSIEILSAIQGADFDKARQLLSKSPCLGVGTKLAEDAMITAITREQPDLVKALVDAGLNLEMPDYDRRTALLIATEPFTKVNAEIVRILVDGGANLNAVGFSGTPLDNLERNHEKYPEAIDIISRKLQENRGGMGANSPMVVRPSPVTPDPVVLQTGITTAISGGQAKPYDNYMNIPQLLQIGVGQNTNLQTYLAGATRLLSMASGGKNFINEAIIADKQNDQIQSARKAQLSSFMNYDDNLDGSVTREEILSNLEKKYRNLGGNRNDAGIQRYIDKAMRVDRNGDGVLTHDEMITLDAGREREIKDSISQSYKQYLDLDPDKDGTLTQAELEAAAQKAFATVDTDGNGVLSPDEVAAFRQGRMAAVQGMAQGGIASMRPEDVENYKITKTVAFIKMVDAAVSTFRDMYNALPGDMPRAETRLPNCESNCSSGDGNGYIGNGAFKKVELFKDERHLFWVHLRRANLLAGYNADSPVAAWGQAFPAAPVGGGFQVYSYNGSGGLPGAFPGSQAEAGLYLMLTNDINGDFSGQNPHGLTAAQAARIDMKIDDGQPLTGSVIAAGDKKCLTEGNNMSAYKQDNGQDAGGCLSLYIRIQAGGYSPSAPVAVLPAIPTTFKAADTFVLSSLKECEDRVMHDIAATGLRNFSVSRAQPGKFFAYGTVNKSDSVIYTCMETGPSGVTYVRAVKPASAAANIYGHNNVSPSAVTGKIDLQSVLQYPASIRTAIIHMIVGGHIDVGQLEFNQPQDFSSLTMVGGKALHGVFHADGGAAAYSQAPGDIMESGMPGTWYFNANWQIQNLGKTGNAGNELIAFLPGVKQAVCAKINQTLGLPSAPVPAATLDEATIEDTQTSTHKTGTGLPQDANILSNIVGQPFGCFLNNANNRYIYYHVLIER